MKTRIVSIDTAFSGQVLLPGEKSGRIVAANAGVRSDAGANFQFDLWTAGIPGAFPADQVQGGTAVYSDGFTQLILSPGQIVSLKLDIPIRIGTQVIGSGPITATQGFLFVTVEIDA